MLSIGLFAVAISLVLWFSIGYVQAYLTYKTAHVFPTQIEAEGWSEEIQALQQDLAFNAPLAIFNDRNSAYISIGISSTTVIGITEPVEILQIPPQPDASSTPPIVENPSTSSEPPVPDQTPPPAQEKPAEPQDQSLPEVAQTQVSTSSSETQGGLATTTDASTTTPATEQPDSSQVTPSAVEPPAELPPQSEGDRAPALPETAPEPLIEPAPSSTEATTTAQSLVRRTVNALRALIDVAYATSTEPTTAPDASNDLATCRVLGRECHTIELSGFSIDAQLQERTFHSASIVLSLGMVAPESVEMEDRLLIRYFHAGVWRSAGEIYLNKEISNATNGGYFSQKLEGIEGWEDMSDIRVVVEYVRENVHSPAQIYLDAAWIDTTFSESVQEIVTGDRYNDTGSNVTLTLRGESGYTGSLILENGDRIVFPYLDNFHEDTLLVRADRPAYRVGDDENIYVSVTNTGNTNDTFRLFVSFPGAVGSVEEISQYLHDVPVATTTPIMSDLTFYCEGGWQSVGEVDGDSWAGAYHCPASGEQYVCSTLNLAKDNCGVSDVTISYATSTIYSSTWVPMPLMSEAAADRKVSSELPKGYSIAASTEGSFDILPGQTLYFKVRLQTPDTQAKKFVLSARGSYFGDMDSLRLKNESSWQFEKKNRGVRALKRAQINDQLTSKVDFGTDEMPNFRFHFKTQRGYFTRLKENVLGKHIGYEVTDVRLVHESGHIEHAGAFVDYAQNDEWTYTIEQMPRSFMPGRYSLEIDITEGDRSYTDSMDFYWGVLAVNPDKAMYAPGEVAHMSIASLDESGNVMCDAQLTLSVRSPAGNTTDVPVISGGGCGHNNVTDLPDYVGDYPVQGKGDYVITLSHISDTGEVINSVTDSFRVGDLSYSVQRTGPTRIYPVSVYKMSIEIEAKEAFSGTVQEMVPEGFNVSETGGGKIIRKDGVIYIVWDVSLSQGERVNLSYFFKAPEVSPYLYLLGPLSIREDIGGLLYQEHRTWKIASDAIAIAAGVAWLGGTQLTDGASYFSELNSATARAVAWSTGEWDDTYYATTTNAGQLQVNQDGDYLVALTMPVERTDNRVFDVTMLEADIRVNGNKIDQGVARTNYSESRNAKTSSNHIYMLLRDLNAGDYIEAYSRAITTVSAFDTIAIGSRASMYVEYIPNTESVFSAVGTTTTISGSNLNSSATTTIKWMSSSGRVDSNYTHNNGSSTAQTITLGTQSDYLVTVNVPVSGAVTNARVRGRVLLGGTMINGGDFKQSYVSNNGNTAASMHWSGVVHATTTNSNLTVVLQQEAAAGTLTVGSDVASIYIQKLPANDIYFARATTTTTGNNFNAATVANIKWGVHDLIDSSIYTFATSSSENITVQRAGDYLLTYNDSLAGAVTRGNAKVQVQVNGVDRTGGQTKTNAVYNVSGDTQTSASMVFLLRDLAVSDVVRLTTIADGVAGTLSADQNALLMLWRKAPQSTWIQATQRWYANDTSSTTPSDPWPSGAVNLNEGDAITTGFPVKSGDQIRLSMALKADVTTATSTDQFKLQYAAGSTCSAALSWTDVGASGSGEIWRAYDNTGLTAGSTLSSTTLSVSTKKETYEESNPSALNPQAVPVDEYGEWNWSLEDNGAPTGTEYCFRMVSSAGTVLKDYLDYPKLVTNAVPDTPTLLTMFDNEKVASSSPWFTFQSTDDNGESLDYQIQISSDPTFTSNEVDENTLTNFNDFDNVSSPSDPQPFNSGDVARFKPTVSFSNNTTYYWRVRAKDSSGTDTWSSWSSTYSFTRDSSVTISTWFQTTNTQFNNDTLSNLEATTSDVGLSGSASSGSIWSQAISYDSHTSGNAWGSVTWNNATSAGTILYHVEYYTSTSSWAIIPESDLPGNSAGTSTQPFTIASLDPDTYSQIRIRADFTRVSGTPRLLDWTVSWAQIVDIPTMSKPFDNEKVATTTPDFRFTTTDPQGDTLVYQIQWSTDPTFGTGVTTKTSDVDTGFTNRTSPSDTSPFTSGNTINFHMQIADALANGTTYWWRVRAKDPTGNNAYSFWSTSQSFTTDTSVTASTWFQTTTAQFNTNALSNVSSASNAVTATTDVGKIAIYRSATAGEAITTSTFTHGFDTTVRQDDIYGISGTTTVIVPAGYYAALYNARFDSTGGLRRSVMQSSLSVASTSQSIGWSQAFMNRAAGATMAFTMGGGIIVAEEDNTPIKVQTFRTDTNSGATLTRTNNTSGLQLIRLSSSWDYLRLSKSSTQTGPTSANWISVTYNSEDEVDTASFGHSAGGSTITLKQAGHYLVFANTYGSLASGSTVETDVIQRLTLNGYELPGSLTTVYMRGNTNSNGIYEGAASIGMIIQSTTTNQTLLVQVARSLGTDSWTINADSSGAYVDRTGITIVKLPEADFIRLTDTGVGNINTASLSPFTWNTEDEKDSSWTHSTVTNSSRLSVNTNGDYLVMAGLYAQDAGVADAVYNQGFVKTGAGSLQLYGQTGSYNPSTASEMGNWSAIILPSLVGSTDYVEVATQALDAAGTVAADSKEVEGLRIGSLAEADTTVQSMQSTSIVLTSGDGPRWGAATSSDAHPGSSSIKYQVLYLTSTSSYNIVPGSELTGNDTTGVSLPVDLSNLNRTTYGTLRLLATFACSGGSCPTINDWTVTWSQGSTISGTIKKADQSTNVTSGAVAVAVNGVLQDYKTGIISNGTWSIPNVTAFADDIITVWVSGASTSTRAAGITKYDGSGDISGINLIEGAVSLGSFDNPTITNGNISQYDNSVSADTALFYNVDAGNDLTVCALTDCANYSLIVGTSTVYRPDSSSSGDVTVPNVQIDGTWIADNNTINVSRSWRNNNAFIKGASTVVFTATSTTESIDSTIGTSTAFYAVTFGSGSGSARWNLISPIYASSTMSINFGTLAPGATSTIVLGGNLSIGASGLFAKNQENVNFIGTGTNTWTDSTASKQDLGYVTIDGSSKTVQLGSDVKAYNLTIGSDDTFDTTSSNHGVTIFGDWTNNNAFTPNSSTVTFAATTTGHTITPGQSSFYNITFNGSGGTWAFSSPTATSTNNWTIQAGNVTLPTATTTIGGSFDSSTGTFGHNNGGVAFNASSGSKTVDPGSNPFNHVTFSGAGSWTFASTNATVSGNLIIAAGTATLPSGTLTVAGHFLNTSAFNNGSGTLSLSAGSAKQVRLGGSSAYNLTFNGSGGSWTFLDTNATSSGSVRFENGAVTLPSGVFATGRDFIGTSGTFSHNSGTVKFIATTTGFSVTSPSLFYNLLFDGAAGGWTITQNATSSANATLLSASSFTLASGATLEVDGTFSNFVASSSQTWTGSTLYLNSGTNYTINSKGKGATYGTLKLGANTNIRSWASDQANASLATTASLYSQDYASSTGSLYIWGAYTSSGEEYWSYATDFDGTALTGAQQRQVNVRIASSSVVTFTGTTTMIGAAAATTTVANQGSGAFDIDISGNSINWQYYAIASTSVNGVEITGTPTITSLANGSFTLTTDGGTSLTIDRTVIDENPQLQIQRVSFATTSVLSAGSNVTETGGNPTTGLFWWFRNSYGNFDGENFDNDPAGNPGYIQWDDSGFTVTVSGNVYSGHGSGVDLGVCDGSNDIVIVTDAGATYSGSCNGSGAYSIPNVFFRAGATIAAYINGKAEKYGVAVTKSVSADLTGFDIYQNAVILRHEDAGPIATTDLAAVDATFDSDIRFSVSGSDLTVKPDSELFIWTGKNFTPGGDVTLQSGGSGVATDGRLWIAANATTTMTSTDSLTIGGGMYIGTSSALVAANSTITFNATTSGKSIYTAASSTLYNVTFNGGGGVWSLDSISGAATTTVMNAFTFSAGTIIGRGDLVLKNSTLAGSGTFTMTGGTIQQEGQGDFGNGNQWQFNNLTFGGTVAASSTKIGAATTTVTGILTVASNYTLNAGASPAMAWVLSGGGTPFVINGTFNVTSAPFNYISTSATNVAYATYAQLFLAPSGAGSPTYTLGGGSLGQIGGLTIGDGTNAVTVTADSNDPSFTVAGNVRISSSATYIASNSGAFNVGGSWSNAGVFTHSNAEVLFNSSATGNTIDAGSSPFYDLTFNSAAGGWTITQNATSSRNTSLTSASSFALQSGKSLEVRGTFSNAVASSSQTWTGSTLYLNSGTSYTINTKTAGNAQYGALLIGPNTKVRSWASFANSTTVDSTGSLYAMNYASSTGKLYIWGAYTRSSGADYWSYATDFDGTDISSSPRRVDVYIATSSSINFTGGTFDIIGDAAATTTIQSQGAGAYSFTISGGTFTANYYQFANVEQNYGVQFSGTPTISSLNFGDFQLAASGTMLTIAGSVIDQNPLKVIKNVKFDTAVGSGYNVTGTSTSNSYWKFNLHYGNRDGEAFDNDGAGDPGYIRWDDSNIAIQIEGVVYSDEGSTISSGCDGSTQYVTLVVEGATSYTTSCASGTGTYAFPSVIYNPGDVFTFYLASSTKKSATVTRGLASSVSGVDIYEHRVIVRTDDVSPLTIDDMNAWDSGNDANVPFAVALGSPNTLTVGPDTKLIVWTGKTFAPAGNVILQSGGSGQSYDGSLEIYAGAMFSASGAEAHSVGGSFIVRDGGAYSPANSTVTLTATTTGKTITMATSTFYNVTFDGGGGNWAFSGAATTSNNFTISRGVVTLPSAKLAVGANFNANGASGGSFMHNNGTLELYSTAAGNSMWTATSTLYDLSVNGSGGSWTWQQQNATTTRNLSITLGTLTLPTSTLAVGGNFTNAATFTAGIGTVKFTSTLPSRSITAGGSSFNNMLFDGIGGGWSFTDQNATSTGDFIITNGSTTLPSISIGIGGSFINSSAFLNNGGTVRLNATAAGKTIQASSSPFYNLLVDSASGGWTMSGSATSTNNTTLTSASSFTLASGATLAVGGTFTNNVGGSWTGSSVYLYAGTTYSINSKTSTAATYGELRLSPNTRISMWKSSAATTTIDSTAYLYSQDHSNVDGSLYIFGAYAKSSGTDYWSYATDFDGTSLAGSERAVSVFIATSSSVSYSGATLNMIGGATASTSVRTSITNTYTFSIAGGTINANYYDFRNMAESGISISGSPVVTSLDYGYFEISAASGTAITLASTAVDTNAALTATTIGFATTTDNIRGYNVMLMGNAGSFWTFSNGYGNFTGESHDADGSNACGHIRWDDSNCLIISESHYRWRNDDGGEGAPNSEWFYDSGFTRRKVIQITNPNNTTYTDIPVKIDVSYDTDMQADFDDLRFTNSSGTTTIAYWREISTAATSTVWVKIASLPSFGSATIYMYYGDSSTSTASSASGTFSFIDDFEDNNITEYSNPNGDTFSTSNTMNHNGTYGLLGGGSPTNPGIFQTGSQTAQGKTIRWFQYFDSGAAPGDESCTQFGVQGSQAVGTGRNYAMCFSNLVSGSNGTRVSLARNVRSRDLSGTIMASTSASFSTGWYEVTVDWLTSGLITAKVYDSSNVLQWTVSTTTASSDPNYYTSGGMGFSYFNQNGGWDTFMVKQYTASPPTSIFGPEQLSGGATWMAAQDTRANTIYTNQNVRLRFSLQNTGNQRLTRSYTLQYADMGAAVSCEAVLPASFANVPTSGSCGSSPACMSSSAQFTNQASTTPLLSFASNLTYTYGKMVEDTSNQTDNLNLASTTATEVEYNFQMTNNASSNDYCFRVVENDLDLDSYDVVARGTIVHPPAITNQNLNNAIDITLTEGATTTIYATSTVTDFNGYADIISATSTVWRNGVAGEANCAEDENNCYQIPASDCSFTNCSGNSCTLSCRVDMYYFADPTDTRNEFGSEGTATSTYYGQGGWRAAFAVQDSSGLRDTQMTLASTTNVLSLYALSVNVSNINYGTFYPGDISTSSATTTVRNTGNRNIDIKVSGDAMAGGAGSISVDRQKYATSSFAWSSCAICPLLTGSATHVDVNISKPTSTTTAQTSDVYWQISVPSAQGAGAYTGTNYFEAAPPGG